MRLSISKSHDQYIKAIASQLGASPQEAINFMLWKLRESNYTFGGQLPPYTPANQQQQPSNSDPLTFERATAMSGLSWQPQSIEAIQKFENVQNLPEEIDPVISRLASLIENF